MRARPPRRADVFGVRAAVAIAVVASLAVLQTAHGQSRWRDVAVPYQSPPAFVQGAYRHLLKPDADAFVSAASELADNWAQHCARPQDASTRAALRVRWRSALVAWAGVVAVPVGPLIERRSGRRIDFHPTRSHLIERGIEAYARIGQPDGAPNEDEAMQRVGSAASGLPAMEWLLWQREPAADAARERAACGFGHRLARELRDEAQAIAAGMAQRAAVDEADADEQAVVDASGEIVNQTLAGLEQLRMQHIERPLGLGQSHGGAPELPRAASGVDAEERAARWRALRQILVFDGEVAPAPGTAVVSIETYLRGRGLNPLADQLRALALDVDARLIAAAGNDPTALANASEALAAIKHLLEADAAPAMDIRIGFSDADGD